MEDPQQQFEEKPLVVFCSDHNNKSIEFFCLRDDMLLCSLCMWDHSDHKHLVKSVNEEDLLAFVDKLEKKLELLHQHRLDQIVQAKQLLCSVDITHSNSAECKDVISAFQISKEILLKPFIQSEQEVKKFVDMGRRKRTTFMEDTALIENPDDLLLLQAWMNMEGAQTDLLYRGTRDGF